jgi:ketosteroid isomerase-like protein
MIKIINCLLLTFAVSSFVAGQTISRESKKSKRLEQEIRQTIQEFDTAVSTGNVQKVESLIADEYLHTDIYGKIQDKNSWLATWLKPLAADLKAGKYSWEIYRSDDIQVNIFSDGVAVAVGRWTLKRSDNPESLAGRFTHVWVKNKKGWQRAAYQATSIVEARKK